MIQNVPNGGELEQTAIRLYFTAWEHIVDVTVPLLESQSETVAIIGRTLTPQAYQHVYEGHLISETTLAESTDRLNEYLDKAQPDLQLCYALTQQAMEIALKARICAVSPFLLLLGSDIRTWARENADFSEFRTLDAADLIRVVNAVCQTPMSEQFATEFDAIRKGRNQIQHLGSFRNKIDPLAAVDILIDSWEELFPGRRWLNEMFSVVISSQYSVVKDEKFNDTTTMLMRINDLSKFVSKRQRRKLLGIVDGVRTFRCWHCYDEAYYREFETEDDSIDTAHWNDERSEIHCVLCETVFQTVDQECINPACNSRIVIEGGDYNGYCALCSVNQQDITDFIE